MAQPKKRKATSLVAAAQKVTPAMRARAEALLAQIARRKERIGEDFYEIGLALRELLEKKLYAALGHNTFKEMLSARGVMGLTQAHKLISLVKSVPREQALKLGQEKAAALVEYTRATPEPDTPETVMERGVLPKGGRASEASTRELLQAAATVRKKTGRAHSPSPEAKAEAGTAKELQAWLRGLGARSATAEVIRRKGKAWVRAEIPLAAARKLTAS